jgi:hypothetical protein
MNSCEKLLRAFIEAQGYEVEEVKERVNLSIIGDSRTLMTVDYKITKKPFDINSEEYTDEMSRLHSVIRESNEYNRRLYLESYDLKKELATLKTGKAHNENL